MAQCPPLRTLVLTSLRLLPLKPFEFHKDVVYNESFFIL